MGVSPGAGVLPGTCVFPGAGVLTGAVPPVTVRLVFAFGPAPLSELTVLVVRV